MQICTQTLLPQMSNALGYRHTPTSKMAAEDSMCFYTKQAEIMSFTSPVAWYMTEVVMILIHGLV